jgi:hypothetical protein
MLPRWGQGSDGVSLVGAWKPELGD